MLVLEEQHSCGLCDAVGSAVKQSPDTFPRLIQVLDLGKLPPVFTEDEIRKQIGLCNKCESKIRKLEEAENLRGALKDLFISRLKHLSGVYNNNLSNHSPNNQCSSQPGDLGGLYGMSLQRSNEVTPHQHSIKRSRTTGYSYHSPMSSDEGLTAVKQSKQLVAPSPIPSHHALPISPASVVDSTNSSDEENIHMVLPPQANQMSPPISPRSSNGSYIMSPGSAATNHSKVLTEVTSSRNRRKQARPAKAAGEVISDTGLSSHAVKEISGDSDIMRTTGSDSDSYQPKISNPPSLITGSMRSTSPLPSSLSRQAISSQPASKLPTPKPPTPKPPTPKSSSPRPTNTSMYPPIPGLTHTTSPALPVSLPLALPASTLPAASSSNPSLPFSNSLYQSMFANPNLALSAAQSAAAAATTSANHSNQNAFLFAQHIYNAAHVTAAAVGQPLLGLQNQFSLAAKVPLPPFQNSSSVALAASPKSPSYSASAPNNVSNLLNSTKSSKKKQSMSQSRQSSANREQGTSSPLGFSLPASGSSASSPVNTPAASNSTVSHHHAAANLASTATARTNPVPQLHPGVAELHTLIKTEQRRYCKVCTSKNRKAKNGRPPQSRFLCFRCTMPMCRNCIEEHRFIMSQLPTTGNGDRSASAKLLHAVNMRQKASNATAHKNRAQKSKPKQPKTTSSLSPPSSSSILFASLSAQSEAASTGAAAATADSQASSTQQPTNLPPLPLTPHDAQLATEFQSIALTPAATAAAESGVASISVTGIVEKSPSDDQVMAATVETTVTLNEATSEDGEAAMDREDDDDGDGTSYTTVEMNISEDEEDGEGDEDDDEYPYDRLVISESPSMVADSTTDGQIVITPEVANETAAMLDSNMDEGEHDQAVNKPDDSESSSDVCTDIKPPPSTANCTSTNIVLVTSPAPETNCGSSNDIPLHCAMTV